MSVTKLLLTVSGGLEDLAERQVRSCFSSLLKVEWKKGPSGSQLYVTLRDSSRIAETIKKLDFVEYVSLLLDDFSIQDTRDNSFLLQQVEKKSSAISKERIDFCKTTCDSIKKEAPNDIELETLDGILIPTPDITNNSIPSTFTLSSEDLGINTIYTKSVVAQSTVETIFDFLSQHSFLDFNKCLWVDTGAGNGALLDHLPTEMSMGIDTNPMNSRIVRMNFFNLTRDHLKQEFPTHQSLCLISNPPFALSSRGDFTPIVQFINHAFDKLDADMMAVICPSKFARLRIWRSLHMTDNARLLGRFFLPHNAFYNPSTGQDVHIHSYCLIFGNKGKQGMEEKSVRNPRGVYLSSRRDKGFFPDLSTSDLTKALVQGLDKAGMELVAERNAKYILTAKLSSSLELWWLLNPQRPCSLVNSVSVKVPNHSLGWLSLSCKPPVALAMASIVMNKDDDNSYKSRVVVNLMSGEGTIELEARKAIPDSDFFFLSGDKNFDSALRLKQRLESLNKKDSRHCRIETIVWDAQHLPLRRGIADAILADLPFQGSVKKKHQTPMIGESKLQNETRLSYAKVLNHAARILRPKGRAALLSPDYKALRHASRDFHWSPLWFSKSVNLGGLSGKLFLMERLEAESKDLSLWVSSSSPDLSSWILEKAVEACHKNEEVEEKHQSVPSSIVTRVELHSTYFHKEKESLSHCYRIWFDDQIRNYQAKEYEQKIRSLIDNNLLEGTKLR